MNKKKGNSNLAMTLLKGRTLFVLIILFIFFSVVADSFCTVNSLLLVCKHVAQYGILGIGMTYVIITGGIDLSVGSVVGLVGMIAGGLIQEGLTLKFAGVTLYFSVPVITVICILLGILVGVINGWLVAKCKLAPFIVTLGTMYIGRGLANIRSGGNTFSNIRGNEALGNTGIMNFDSRIFAVGDFPGIPIAAVLFLILAAIAAFVLKKTPFGWHILAIGGNEKAARLSGIKVEKNTIMVYAISGACSALIGLVTMGNERHRGSSSRRNLHGRRCRYHRRNRNRRFRNRYHQRWYDHVWCVRVLAESNQRSCYHPGGPDRPVPEKLTGQDGSAGKKREQIDRDSVPVTG